MNPKEILDEARTYVPDTNPQFPVTEATLYARINARQRQLFAIASSWNQEYFGRSVTGAVVDVEDAEENVIGRCVDLDDLEETTLWPVETVDHVEVADVGTSAVYAASDLPIRLTICRADEQRSHLPPRVMLRSHTLEAVGDDLEGIAELRIWYSRRPRKIDTRGQVGDRVEDVEIGDPWEWLLVWDLVKTLTKYVAQTDSEKDHPVVTMAKESEMELLAIFKQHVLAYGRSTEQITE